MTACAPRRPKKIDSEFGTAKIVNVSCARLIRVEHHPPATCSSDIHCCAQAQHGSAPDIAGQDKANPVSMILSVAMLIDWLGQKRGIAAYERAAAAMSAAIDRVLEDPASRTADLGGALGCKAFGEKAAAALATA